MKKISFSKLWESNAYYKIENIHLPRQKVWKGLHESWMG
jgi:hypothetical protein